MKKAVLYIVSVFCSLPLYAQNSEGLFTLEQCVQMARQYNRTLQNAALDVDAASEQKKEAFSNYFPKISANVTAFYMFDKMIKQDFTVPDEIAYILPALKDYSYSIREFNSMYFATLSAIEPVYAGGRIHTGNKLADLQKDVMTLQRDLKESDVEQKVTEHFWKIAQIKYNLSSLDAADKYLESIMESTRLYIKAGIKTHNDELRVMLRQQELASNRIRLDNAQHIMLLLLAQEIGAADSMLTDSMKFDIVIPESSIPTSPEEAMSESCVLEGQGTAGVQYQLALKNVEAQQLQVKMERAKMLPMVGAGVMGFRLGLGGLSDNVQSVVNPNMTNGLVLGAVSVPITDWIGGSHAIKRQKMKVQQAKNDADDACEKLIVDLESSWSNVVEAYEQIKVRQVGVQQAAENLRLSSSQYRNGMETLTDLLDAELLNRQTQDAFSSALADYQIRLADYKRKIE